MVTLSLPLAPPPACSARRPAPSRLCPRFPSRSTLAVCLAAKTKVPLPIASPPPLGDDPAKWDPAECDALLRGGEQVASVLQEMLKLMEGMEMDGEFAAVAVELVAQGVIGNRVDEMESGFLMALDYMIQMAQKDGDDERHSLLEVVKQTVLDHLTKKCPPHVQVVGLLCQTEKKDSRHELLRRVAAGGGVFENDKGLKCQIPGANLNDIANHSTAPTAAMASSASLQSFLPASAQYATSSSRRRTGRARPVQCAAVSAPSSSSASPPAGTVPAERLEPRVEQREGGYWVLKEKYRTSLNPQEKVKLGREPMTFFTEGGIKDLAKIPMEEIDANKLTKEDVDVRLKWLGLFHRRKQQYGRFMMRLKLPNGVTTSEQTRYLAGVIEKYGKEGCADVTTRQNWQIRGVTLPDVPEILDGLRSVGLTSLQSGMDNVRNPVGNPLAGIDPDEIVDTRPYTNLLSAYITNNSEGNLAITNLPRKWNVCVIGTHDLFEHPHINDLAYIPAEKDGKFGFNLLVGGFISPKRWGEALPLDAWVPGDDIIPVCKAVLEAYRDLGTRGNRQKTRMMWLIDELGMEVFRSEIEKRMPNGVLERAAAEDLIDKKWERRDYLGVHPQKQEGLSFVGLHVPVGRLQAADMFELARLADEYGSGELRLTVEQNIVLPNVKNEKVDALLAEPLLQERFSAHPSLLMKGLVACTGNQFCGQAIIETKQRALQVTRDVEARVSVPKTVRMHWTGCPNSCAQVQVADIGFMGCLTKNSSGKIVEAADIFVGGRVGSDSHLTGVHRKAVPCEDVVPIVADLLVERFGAVPREREEDED